MKRRKSFEIDHIVAEEMQAAGELGYSHVAAKLHQLYMTRSNLCD